MDYPTKLKDVFYLSNYKTHKVELFASFHVDLRSPHDSIRYKCLLSTLIVYFSTFIT